MIPFVSLAICSHHFCVMYASKIFREKSMGSLSCFFSQERNFLYKKACRLRHAAPLLRRVSDKLPLQKRAHPCGAFFTL